MNNNTYPLVYVRDFIKNNLTDSEIIENCISFACAEFKNPVVVLDKNDWYIDRAVLLPPNITIIIDGCSVKQNNEIFDNVFRGENVLINPNDPYDKPVEVQKTENIKIIGKNNAKIIGCDKNKIGYHSVLKNEQEMTGDFWGYRTHQISLSNCDGFEISGLEFTKTRGWAICFDSCSDIYVHDLHIVSNVKNGDGVNFRSGCHHCKVENITGHTSDDTVACTALCTPNKQYPIKNYLYPSEPYNCLYDGNTAQNNDIHDISISGIYTGGFHHGVICLAANGNKVYNVNICDVIEKNEGEREAAVKLYTGYGGGYNANDIHDITVRNVSSCISGYAVMCNAEVCDVVLRNITQSKPDGSKYNLAFENGITIDI